MARGWSARAGSGTFEHAAAVGWHALAADLADAALQYADLAHADLRRADLSHANLAYTDLDHARLGGADLSHATFCHTTMPDGRLNNTGC